MKSFLLPLLSLVVSLVPADAAEPVVSKLRVFFIGNSLTSTNDLPGMLTAMAEASGKELTIGSKIVGGATLEKHWTEEKALAKIKEAHWDYVVLQDLSKQAYTDKDAMFRYGKMFDEEIRKTGAKTALYMTWPLEDSLNNYQGIADAYSTLARDLHATLVPAGTAWHAVTSVSGKPSFQLYVADHKHPTPAGTYLAASVFYRVLFQAPSTGLPGHLEAKQKVLANLSKDDAAALQKIADTTPLDGAKQESAVNSKPQQ
jgi:hypothetical protein